MYKQRVGINAGVTSHYTLATRLGGLAPTLSLDFLSGSLDSRVTFSRGSNATLVDSTGKVTYAPNNLLPYSQEFDNAGWTKGNSTVTANSVTAPDGTLTADTLTENTSNAFHAATRSVTLAGTLTLSCYLKAGTRNFAAVRTYDGTNGDRYAVFNLSTGTAGAVSGNTTAAITAVGGGWYRCSMTYTFASASGSAGVTIQDANSYVPYTGNGTGDIYLWGAQLEQVTYQTTPSTYNATTASAYYGPRFDYDPVTLAPKGLLVEEARTNNLLYSNTFSATAWGVSNIAVTNNTSTAPDGTSTASTFTASGASASRYVFSFNSITAAASTASFYMKAGTNQFAQIFFSGDGTSYANFDLINGTVGSTAGTATASIVSVGNGWYRCIAVNSSTAVNGAGIAIIPAANSVRIAASTLTTTILVYGAQLEAGAFATSYIPTVASQVTRSADVATMTGTNFSSWYNGTEGTFVVKSIPQKPTLAAGTPRLFTASDGTENNRVMVDFPSTNARGIVSTGGINQALLTIAYTANININLGLAYKANDFAFAKDGGSPATAASGTVPSGLTTMQIGATSTNTNQFSGCIQRVTYYPQRLPNNTLQRLTA